MWQYNQTVLQHHGVLGMKWGRRKASAAYRSAASASVAKDKASGNKVSIRTANNNARKAGKKAYSESVKIDKAAAKKARADAKLDKPWSKGFKDTAKKAMDDTLSDAKVQKKCESELGKLMKSGLKGTTLENAYQDVCVDVMNNHLKNNPIAKSPSGKSYVQVATVSVQGHTYITPYEKKFE